MDVLEKDYFINDANDMEELDIIKERCQDFLKESKGYALFKNLPTTYADFQKVKVRVKKETSEYDSIFNEAFDDEITYLRQRAIFTNGYTGFEPNEDNDYEPFYIFPIDGYNFLYSNEVENSSNEYKRVFDVILEEFGDEKGKDIIIDILKFNYISERLPEGIDKGCEIIIYGIPFYYALRVSCVKSYGSLYETLIKED